MNKKKEKLLIIILIVIVCLIIGATILVINYYHKNKISVEDIYGKWLANSSQFIVDDHVDLTIDKERKSYIVINKETIDVCYYNDDDSLTCNKYNYSLNDNYISIENNDSYLSDDSELLFENGYLIFKKEYDEENKYVQMIFERE